MMPAIFLFIFWTMPSGLVLYWTAQNILQIGQQLYSNYAAKKKPEDEKKLVTKNKPADEKKPVTKGKPVAKKKTKKNKGGK